MLSDLGMGQKYWPKKNDGFPLCDQFVGLLATPSDPLCHRSVSSLLVRGKMHQNLWYLVFYFLTRSHVLPEELQELVKQTFLHCLVHSIESRAPENQQFDHVLITFL